MKTFAEFITEITGKGKLYDIERDNAREAAFATHGMPGKKSKKPGVIAAHKRREHFALKSGVAKALSKTSERRGHVDRFDPDDRPAGRLEYMKKTMAKYRASRDSLKK